MGASRTKWQGQLSLAPVLAFGLGSALPASADEVIPDDLIVQGSACVGPVCANNEPFGFDTLRLSGDVLRLSFIDTSNAPFPTTDWQITINDDDAGSVDRFSVRRPRRGTANTS